MILSSYMYMFLWHRVCWQVLCLQSVMLSEKILSNYVCNKPGLVMFLLQLECLLRGASISNLIFYFYSLCKQSNIFVVTIQDNSFGTGYWEPPEKVRGLLKRESKFARGSEELAAAYRIKACYFFVPTVIYSSYIFLFSHSFIYLNFRANLLSYMVLHYHRFLTLT